MEDIEMEAEAITSDASYQFAKNELSDQRYELTSALSYAERKALPKSSFAIPENAPGPGSYPIPDIDHARNALARSSGKPEEGRVRRAVCRKYPQLCRDNGGN